MTNRRNNIGIQCKNKKQRDQKSASSAGRALHIRNQYVRGHEAWPPRGGDLVIEIVAPTFFWIRVPVPEKKNSLVPGSRVPYRD